MGSGAERVRRAFSINDSIREGMLISGLGYLAEQPLHLVPEERDVRRERLPNELETGRTCYQADLGGHEMVVVRVGLDASPFPLMDISVIETFTETRMRVFAASIDEFDMIRFSSLETNVNFSANQTGRARLAMLKLRAVILRAEAEKLTVRPEDWNGTLSGFS